jgi:uncharacterized membrane protein (UPF0182 family)
VILFGTLAGLTILANVLATAWVDRSWYQAQGAGRLWTTLTMTRFALGAVGFVWIASIVGGSLLLASRNGGPTDTNLLAAQFTKRAKGRGGWLAVAIVLWCTWRYGLGFRFGWNDWLLFSNGSHTGAYDPVFNRDIGRYLFDLPFISRLLALLWTGVVTALALSTATYLVNGGIRVKGVIPRSITAPAKRHLLTLGALAVVVVAVRLLTVGRLQLAVSPGDGFSGASYVDDHVREPIYVILGFALIVVAAAMIVTAFASRIRRVAAIAFAAAAVSALVGVAIPGLVQRLKVNPARAKYEADYVTANRTNTISAWALGAVDYAQVDIPSPPTDPPKAADPDTTASSAAARIPLLDPASAPATFAALRAVQNYTIGPATLDRYPIGDRGEQRPVAISAQMTDRQHLSDPWEEAQLVYTHGRGVVIAYADEFDDTGRPAFIDPTSPTAPAPIRLDSPEMYFGPGLDGWPAVLNTSRVPTDGETQRIDIPLDGAVSRVLAAIAFRQPSLLLSDYLGEDSGLITRRSVSERLGALAPFLSQVEPAYPVITKGRIVWMAPLATVSATYPGAQFQMLNAVTGPRPVNYARASVLGTVDALTGEATLYPLDDGAQPAAADGSDPLLTMYRNTFPDLFTPVKDLPVDLRDHLLFPSTLLEAQSSLLGKYRVKSGSEILERSQEWTRSADIGRGVGAVPTGQLAATTTVDLIDGTGGAGDTGDTGDTTSPPLVRQNVLVPGVAAAQRPETAAVVDVSQEFGDYGQLHVSAFGSPSGADPQDGPTSIQRTIESDARISWVVTQLNQSGSNVTFGPLALSIIDHRVVATRPVYVASTGTGSFSRLLAVALVSDGQAVLAPTVDLGLAALDDPALAARLAGQLLPATASESSGG